MKKGKKMKPALSDINPQKMDSQKWDMLLDLLEHPEKYSETQKDELLGDEEVNELYQLQVETRQSLDFAKSKEKMKMPSIDAEWEKLKDEMKLKEEKQQKDETKQNAETKQTASSLESDEKGGCRCSRPFCLRHHLCSHSSGNPFSSAIR